MSTTDTFYNISSQVLYFNTKTQRYFNLLKNNTNVQTSPVIKIPILDPIQEEYLELELNKYFPTQYISETYFYIIPNLNCLESLLIIKFKIPFQSIKKVSSRILMIDLTSGKFITNLEINKIPKIKIIPSIYFQSFKYLEILEGVNSEYKNNLPQKCLQDWQRIFKSLSIPRYFLKYNSILDTILQKKQEHPQDSIWFHLSQLPNELILVIFSYLNLNSEIWIDESILLKKFSPRNNTI